MFEAIDKVVGGPLSQTDAKISEINRTVEGKITQTPNTFTPPSNDPAKVTEKEKVETTKQNAAEATAVNSKEQVKKLDTSNDLLQQIAETTQRQVELSEKQLVALTMSEAERADSQTRSNLRKDNRFGSQYGYA
jgi:hypothetical protein